MRRRYLVVRLFLGAGPAVVAECRTRGGAQRAVWRDEQQHTPSYLYSWEILRQPRRLTVRGVIACVPSAGSDRQSGRHRRNP